MNVLLLSLWRNDSERQFQKRIDRLLSIKSNEHKIEWFWTVGDSSDDTHHKLLNAITNNPKKVISVLNYDTDIIGDDSETRLKRLSKTVNESFDIISLYKNLDYVIIHESDLISPMNLVDRFLNTEKQCVAGWVTLGSMFYDTWAYRGLDGVRFTNEVPYHTSYKSDGLFEVSSFGSAYMFPFDAILNGMRCENGAVLDICKWLRQHGYSLWVDPTIPIIQPESLWESQVPANF